MRRLGQVRFQSNDKMDVFHVAEVWEDGSEQADGQFMNIPEGAVADDPPWVNSKPLKFQKVDIDGDTVYLQAWLNGDPIAMNHVMTVYIEYETDGELPSGSGQVEAQSKAGTDMKPGTKESSEGNKSVEDRVSEAQRKSGDEDSEEIYI